MKIKHSALISGMSGKLGGSYAADGSGFSVLRRVNNRNRVNTSSKQFVKAVNKKISSAWLSLSNQQRLSWLQNSDNGKKGYALYYSRNFNRVYNGSSPLSYYVAPGNVQSLKFTFLALVSGQIYLALDNINLDGSTYLDVYMSYPVTAGTSHTSAPVRHIYNGLWYGFAIPIGNLYISKWGRSLVQDDKVVVKVQSYNATTGKRGMICESVNVVLHEWQYLDIDAGGSWVMACGINKMISTFSGNAVQLVRQSTGLSLQFAFIGNDLPWDAITTWAAGDTILVRRVYDQSGNGRNLYQASNTRAPRLDLVNRCINLNGGSSGYYFTIESSFSGGGAVSMYCSIGAKCNNATNVKAFLGNDGTNFSALMWDPLNQFGYGANMLMGVPVDANVFKKSASLNGTWACLGINRRPVGATYERHVLADYDDITIDAAPTSDTYLFNRVGVAKPLSGSIPYAAMDLKFVVISTEYKSMFEYAVPVSYL